MMKSFNRWTVLGLLFLLTHAYAGNPVSLIAPVIPNSMVSGTGYGPYTYTLTNNVGQAVNLAPGNPISVTGSASAIASITNYCPSNAQGYYVPMGGCAFALTLTPSAAGSVSGNVNVAFSGGAIEPTLVSAIPIITVIPSTPTATLSIAAAPTSMYSGSIQGLIYTVTNTGSLTIDSMVISGYSGNASLVANGCVGTLAPAHSCQFSISLAPEATDIGSGFNQNLSVQYGGVTPLTYFIQASVLPPILLAVGNLSIDDVNSMPYVLESLDLGFTWSEQMVAGVSGASNDALYSAGGGKSALLLGGQNSQGNAFQYYNNGSGWSMMTIGTSRVSAFTYGVGYFVSVSSTPSINYSTDGISWHLTSVTMGTSNSSPTVAYGNRFYVASFNGGSGIATLYYTRNPNGTWSTTTVGAAGEWFQGLAYGNGAWILVGQTGSNAPRIYKATAPSGPWTRVSTSGFSTTALMAAAYGNATFVVVGNDGSIYTSPDGTAWTPAVIIGDLSAQEHCLSFSASTGVFVLVGANGHIYTSTNGSTWGQSALLSVPANIVFTGVSASTQTY